MLTSLKKLEFDRKQTRYGEVWFLYVPWFQRFSFDFSLLLSFSAWESIYRFAKEEKSRKTSGTSVFSMAPYYRFFSDISIANTLPSELKCFREKVLNSKFSFNGVDIFFQIPQNPCYYRVSSRLCSTPAFSMDFRCLKGLQTLKPLSVYGLPLGCLSCLGVLPAPVFRFVKCWHLSTGNKFTIK